MAGGATLVSCVPESGTPTPTSAPSATQRPEPTVALLTDIPQPTNTSVVQNITTVYMTTNISADGLMQIYEALGRKATGKVAVKVHSGEPGGHLFLQPDFIESLVKDVKGTIVECNTAYGGRRSTTESHQVVIDEHGFTAIATVDIMEADGAMSIPIVGGKHLKEDIVGSHFVNHDFFINLAHFKGHMMGGFGGVFKNMSIVIAASVGKSLIHSAGTQTTGFGMGTPHTRLATGAFARRSPDASRRSFPTDIGLGSAKLAKGLFDCDKKIKELPMDRIEQLKTDFKDLFESPDKSTLVHRLQQIPFQQKSNKLDMSYQLLQYL